MNLSPFCGCMLVMDAFPHRIGILFIALNAMILLQPSPPQLRAADPDVLKRYDSVIQGFFDGRDQLETGLIRYRLLVEFRTVPDGGWHRTETEGIYAFDIERNRFRMNGRTKGTKPDGSAADIPKGFDFAIFDGIARSKYPGEPDSRRLKRGKEDLPEFAQVFDFRSIGIAHAAGWNRYDFVELEQIFARQRDDVFAVEKTDACARVTWIFPMADQKPGFKRSVWFREDRDFVPERLEISFPKRAAKGEIIPGEWNAPQQRVEVSREKFRGRWVPRKATIQYEESEKRELNFDWKSLNEELDRDLFDIEISPDLP